MSVGMHTAIANRSLSADTQARPASWSPTQRTASRVSTSLPFSITTLQTLSSTASRSLSVCGILPALMSTIVCVRWATRAPTCSSSATPSPTESPSKLFRTKFLFLWNLLDSISPLPFPIIFSSTTFCRHYHYLLFFSIIALSSNKCCYHKILYSKNALPLFCFLIQLFITNS